MYFVHLLLYYADAITNYHNFIIGRCWFIQLRWKLCYPARHLTVVCHMYVWFCREPNIWVFTDTVVGIILVIQFLYWIIISTRYYQGQVFLQCLTSLQGNTKTQYKCRVYYNSTVQIFPTSQSDENYQMFQPISFHWSNKTKIYTNFKIQPNLWIHLHFKTTGVHILIHALLLVAILMSTSYIWGSIASMQD